jgi:hypothetical protein
LAIERGASDLTSGAEAPLPVALPFPGDRRLAAATRRRSERVYDQRARITLFAVDRSVVAAATSSWRSGHGGVVAMRWDKVAVLVLAVGLFVVLGERVAVSRPAPAAELVTARTLSSAGPGEGRNVAELVVDRAADRARGEAFGADAASPTAFADGQPDAAAGSGEPAPALRTTLPEASVGISDHGAIDVVRTTALPFAVFTLGTVLVGLGLSRHRLDV